MPEVKVFSKSNPCTKVDLYNCFMTAQGYQRRAVVEAQAEIGANSPKYLLREGYAVYRTHRGIDYYELTREGQDWLTKGLEGHLKRHPDDRRLVKQFPASK